VLNCMMAIIMLAAVTAVQCQPITLETLRGLALTEAGTAQKLAEPLVQERLGAEDLDGAIQVLTAVTDPVISTNTHFPAGYSPRLARMIADISVLARARGDWYALGMLRIREALMTRFLWSSGCPPAAPRCIRQLQAAKAAFERAGRREERYGDWFDLRLPDFVREWPVIEREQDASVNQVMDGTVAEMARKLVQHVGNENDPEAVNSMLSIVQAVDGDWSDAAYTCVAELIGSVLWVPGADVVIPALRNLIDQRGDPSWGLPKALYWLIASCNLMWSGEDDIFLDTYEWSFQHFVLGRHLPPYGYGFHPQALLAYGRAEEAEKAMRMFAGLIIASPECLRYSLLPSMTWPGMPADLRREIIDLVCQNALWAGNPRGLSYELTPILLDPRRLADPDTTWASEMAMQVLPIMLQLAEPGKDQSPLTALADLLRFAKLTQLEAEVRGLAARLQEAGPSATLNHALAAARRAVSEGRWGDVPTGLEPAMADWEASTVALQSALLLHEAYLRLCKPAEADKWIQKAWGLVNSLKMAPAEKANYLMTMANLCDVAMRLVATEAEGERENGKLTITMGRCR